MSSFTQNKLSGLLTEIDHDVRKALENIYMLIEVDDKFKNCFLQTVNRRLNQTYDRFEIDELFIENSKNNDNSQTTSNRRENYRFKDPHKHKDDSKSRKIKPTNRVSSKKLNSKEKKIGITELQEQAKMRYHILVSGVPKMGHSENLQSIFQKICDEIGVRIRSKDVIHIERMEAAKCGLAVELRSLNLKRLIKKQASKCVLSCRHIIKSSKCPDFTIKIVDYLTPYFLKMIRYANRAIQKKLIATANITLNGVYIKRDADHDGRYFLLLVDLEAYIHQLEDRNKSETYSF